MNIHIEYTKIEQKKRKPMPFYPKSCKFFFASCKIPVFSLFCVCATAVPLYLLL